jgi:hypothetical protein
MTRLRGLLVLASAAGFACGNDDEPDGFADEIQFDGQRDLLPGFEYDSGFVPAESPAAIRIVVRGEGGVTAKARVTTDGVTMTPVPGSGELSMQGELRLEVSARIDTAGIEFEDVVDAFVYAIPEGTASFEPFLLDESATVQTELPPGELARVPIGAVPGASVVIEVAGGSLSTVFAGACAEAVDGAGQYVGHTTTSGTVDLQGTIEVEIPIVGTETYGPFAVTVDVPALDGEIDLGVRSLQTGEPLQGVQPCADVTVGTGDDGDDDPPGDGAGETGSATTSPADDGQGAETSGDPDAGSTDTGSPGMDTNGDPCMVDVDCAADEMCVNGSCVAEPTCEDCQTSAQYPGGACNEEAVTCSSNPDCVNLITCINPCADQACVDECFEFYPAGEMDFMTFYVCLFGEDGQGGACGQLC